MFVFQALTKADVFAHVSRKGLSMRLRCEVGILSVSVLTSKNSRLHLIRVYALHTGMGVFIVFVIISPNWT